MAFVRDRYTNFFAVSYKCMYKFIIVIVLFKFSIFSHNIMCYRALHVLPETIEYLRLLNQAGLE